MRQFQLFFLALLFFIILSLAACKNLSTKEDFSYMEYDIAQIREAYDRKELTVEKLTREYLRRIEKIDRKGPALHSLICINPDALKIARELDKELVAGKSRGPLHGIPVVIKDNIDTHDKMPCTAGSRALKDSYPLRDSPVVRQLREAGALILGKANLSEWANFRGDLSSSGWSAVGGQTKNPYILDRNPCGSSSGSAVAVSANLCMLAIGTETNGSIICPAHANGIVGIKPTVGLISRTGVIPIAWTLDTPGPMARTVRDAALCLGALAESDADDAATLQKDRKAYSDYTQFLDAGALKGKRIAYDCSYRGINFKVDALMDSALALMKEAGATIIEVSNILDKDVRSHAFQIMLFEYREGLNKYFASLGENAKIRNLQELIDFNIADEIELAYFDQKYLEMAQAKKGTNCEEYRNTLKKMREGSREKGIDRIMEEYNLDAIAAPSGGPPWKTDLINGDSFQFGSYATAAIAGYPNISLPMGFIEGLPVGISIFGRAWSEPELLAIAYAYEQISKHRKAPEFLLP